MAAQQRAGTNETIQHLGDFLSGGGERTIGALVFWSLSGVSVERSVLRAEFEAIGMKAAVPRDPRHATSLTTAVKALCVGKPNVLARRLAGGWGIVVESTEAEAAPAATGAGKQQRLRHHHLLSVLADPMELTMQARQREHPETRAPELAWRFTPRLGTTDRSMARALELAREIEQKYLDARRLLDTSDLSTILVNAMHGTTKDSLLAAVSLRQTTGGLYFVHGSKLGELGRLREVVEKLAPNSSITVLTITGNDANLEAASKAARTSFRTQLAELREEMAEFRASTPVAERDDQNIRTRAARFTQLAGRVQLFRDVLGDIAGELGAEIDQARGELERLLDAP